MSQFTQTGRRRNAAAAVPASPAFAPSHPSLGGGQSLDRGTQREMSARFGHNFSQVRIHTDQRAGASAHALGAAAFALGGDIVFGEGQWTPGSPSAERLLAHELTHVVQQAQNGPGDPGRSSRKDDASEREAESAAGRVLSGESVSVQAAPQAAVARWGLDDYDPNPTPGLPAGPMHWGNQPAEKSNSGPYAYSNYDPVNIGGYSVPGGGGGFGLAHAHDTVGGVPFNDDIMAGSLNYGAMKDSDGNTRFGGKVNGSVAAMDFNKGGAVSGDVQAFNASAEATFGDDGATLGAGANVLAGSITAKDEHQTARLGLSEGVGLAGRAYWGQGQDGFRNYGFGFDAGPLSVDLKTNDPLRTGVGLIPGLGTVAQQFLPGGNMTEDAANMVGLSTKNADLGTTWDAAKGMAGDAYNSAADTVSSAYNTVSDAVSNFDPSSVLN